MRSFWPATFLSALVSIEPSFAQKIVDPNAVAPEYREAAKSAVPSKSVSESALIRRTKLK